MKSSMKKILLAVISLMFAAAMVGTSTYAWFSMNNKVDVTGMTVMATVDQNLLVAADTLDQSGRLSDTSFGNTLVQSVSGTLKPVSSVNGKDFFYTDRHNVKGDGSVMNKVYVAYDRDDGASATAFNANYKSKGAVGYVDYVFQLKAVNYSADAEIRLTKLDLIYGDGENSLKVKVGKDKDGNDRYIDTKAFRVAVFYKDVTEDSEVSAPLIADDLSDFTTLALFKPEGATNFDANKAVGNNTTAEPLGAVSYCASDLTAKIDIAGEDTKYYKFVVRLWLEGEDNTCRSDAYVTLNEKWSLDLEFNQVLATDPANSVVYLNQKTMSGAKTDIPTTTALLSEGTVKINGNIYYPIKDKKLNGDQLYAANNLPLTPDSKIYVIPDLDKLYLRDVTNQVTITPPTVDSTKEHATIKVTLTDGKLSNDKTPDVYVWKRTDGADAKGLGAGTKEFSPEEAGTYYCLITDTDGIVYKTTTYTFSNAVWAKDSTNVSAIIYNADSYSWKKADDDSEVGTQRTLVSPAEGTYYCEAVKGGDNYVTIVVSILDANVDGADPQKGSVTLTATKLSNGKTPDTYAWKYSDGSDAPGTYDEQEYTATITGDYYCEVTSDDGIVYRTKNVHLVTP